MPARVDVPDDFGLRPFTLADARALKLSKHVVGGSRFRRIFRGVYIRADVEVTDAVAYDAVSLLTSDPYWATCHTAAGLYGVPVPEVTTRHIGLPPGLTRPRDAALASHRHATQPPLNEVDGRRVATAEDTFCQLAAYLSLVDLVIVGDALVRLGQTNPDTLVTAAASACGRGVRLARRAAQLVRDRVDSPMETRLRLLIVLAGLPEPRVNRDARDEHGGWIARPDLSYPEERIAIEYDGQVHLRRKRRNKDLRRQAAYDDNGWKCLVVVDNDVFVTPGRTVNRIWSVLRQRQHPQVPADTSQQWRDHFGPHGGNGSGRGRGALIEGP